MADRIELNGSWRVLGLKVSKREQDRLRPGELEAFVTEDRFAAKLSQPEFDVPARVPGDVWQDLLRAGKIPHPYKDLNCPKLQWIEDRLWVYRTTFASPKGKGRQELVFEGLDTLAAVVLNGRCLGVADNMFRTWRFDATDALSEKGKNELLVVFPPLGPYLESKPEVDGQWAPFHKGRAWVRKAQMEFSWDWGPRIVLAGMWKPAYLRSADAARIEGWHFRTVKLGKDKATCRLGLELSQPPKKGWTAEVTLRHGKQKIEQSVKLAKQETDARIEIPDPALWQPAGMGKQNLYDLSVVVKDEGGKAVDRLRERVGIRTIRILQKPQGKDCRSFTLEVNGRKVFAAGGNWIPAESFISGASDERYRRLLQLAQEANFNCVRIWGGGIYEPEVFYRTCDELGLLVWQDFMFSCAAYPGNDAAFVANVRAEAVEQVKRLRNHPCLALWCGNNENQWIDDQCHWNKKSRKLPCLPLYEKVLPEIVASEDGTTPYWASSPIGGDDHNDYRQGDHHAWKVWAGIRMPRQFGEDTAWPKGVDRNEMANYRHYSDLVPRFVSEFGLQGLPYRRTLEPWLDAKGFTLRSKAILFRDKTRSSLERVQVMLAGVTGPAKSYEQLERYTQFVQAKGLSYAIEHYRRNLWDCSGAVIWQLNDCWPGFSWSLVDYDLRGKPAYFSVRRACAPRMLSIVRSADGTFELHAVNQMPEAWKASVRIRVADFRGRTLASGKVDFTVGADAAKKVSADLLRSVKMDAAQFVASRCYLTAEAASGGKAYPAYWVADPVELELPKAALRYETAEKKVGGTWRYTVRMETDSLALYAGVVPPNGQCVFEDNFMHVEAGRIAEVRFDTTERVKKGDIEVRWFDGGKK
ncbi:MAG: glycoside hydrolase family 2 protein [Phycisphaerae bacterium]|nr:glycoside hydrolase family 2 protein [Phycisphaerae bacterium]